PHLPMITNQRISAGVQQSIAKYFTAGATYTYGRGSDLLVGRNLNLPVNGVRPDPAFANIIESMPDGKSRQHVLAMNFNVFVPNKGGPGAQASGPRWVWKRGFGLFGNVLFARTENNTDGRSEERRV